MATTTNFGWETPDDTDLVKDGAAAIRTLGSAIDTSLVDLKGGTTGQVLSKTSNTDMDFTWVTSDDANAIQNAIVDAKGDLIAASAADTPARLAVGNNGEILVADSSSATGLRWQGDYAAGKNKIINGDFRIWQRGTSTTTNDTYLADRWRHFWDGNGTFTVSQQSFTAGSAPVAGYEAPYFQRLAHNTSGTTTYYQTFTRIEDVRVLAGQTATLSFWAKANTNTTLNYYVEQIFGSGGSATVLATSGTQSLTTSWQRFTVTFSMPSISGKTLGTNNYVQVTLRSTSIAAGASIDFWGVQLEAGNTATAFQTATGTLAGELAACQRYYYVVGGVANGYPIVGGALIATNNQIRFPIKFPSTMRIAPSITKNGTWNVSANTTQPAAVFIGQEGFSIEISSSSGAVNAAYAYPDSTDDTFTCSSEL